MEDNPVMATSATLTTSPGDEPLSLAEVKTHLRVEFNDDDADILALISAAREHIESVTRRAMITQTWQAKLDAFPGFEGVIELPKGPLQSVTSIAYIDDNGDSQTLASSKYIVDTVSVPPRITPAYGLYWPVTRNIINAVTITFVTGHGDDKTNVPSALIHAMKLLIGHWYENREATAPVSLSDIPAGVDALIAPYKVHTFY